MNTQTVAMPAVAAAAEPTRPASNRLLSIDAYRGFVMVLMMGEVLKFHRVAEAVPESGFWKFLAYHQSHVEWIGCSLHDLIQPSFSFLVGVALPFSIAARIQRGQSRAGMTLHAAGRALALILLGVFLRSTGKTQTYWTFEDTLTQIGLGYVFLFLLGWQKTRVQWIALAVIVAGYWAAFALFQLPSADFDYPAVGVPQDWPHLMTGFAGHWNKNSNLAWSFDTWFLNLFPRKAPFTFNGGGYATLSFVPTLGTMVLGLIAGSVLRASRDPWSKMKWLSIAGVIGLGLGAALGWTGICPVVKRIWTPTWVIFSGGWCLLLLAGFYAVIEIGKKSRWAFPLIVVGMNSIAAYCIAHLFEGFILKNLSTHLSSNAFVVFGNAYRPLVHGALALLVMWLILWWMHRQKIYLRI
jgi:predicted acyltransferase